MTRAGPGPEDRLTAAPGAMTDMVERIPLLSPPECRRVLAQVEAHRADWLPRYPGLPFYTLGAASYLDAGPGRDGYYEKAASFNPLLEREFGWLYDRLRGALADHLRTAVTFEPRAARPGFHVFLAHPAFRRPLARVHFDLQFQDLEWTDEAEMDFTRPFSFTLAVRLPRSGAGLRIWETDKAVYDALSPEARERVTRETPLHYVPYREGELICHSGLVLHQIAPAGDAMQPDDMRVTLQGHALPGRDGHHVYW